MSSSTTKRNASSGEGDRLPSFLESFENLTAHFEEHFGDRGSNERGDTFLDLALKITALLPEGQDFPAPQLNEKKSHDGGVDFLTATTQDGRMLCAQSKYKLRTKDEFDTVISKFRNFEVGLAPPTKEPDLFAQVHPVEQSGPLPTFILVTSSKLEGIIKNYEKSSLTSREHYNDLLAEKRLVIVDGPRILTLLQQLYKKAHLIPANITLNSRTPWHECGNIYLGTVSGNDLVKLYESNGDALFFENIRDFLGTTSGKVVTTRSTVNEEIIRTVSNEPEKMLARNNGLTFRATEVKVTSDGRAELSMAAIVNGCQTTMCLVHCAPVSDTCMVQVKIVETVDAWDIAKAANYQNPVTRVDLDLARYLRPQLVRRVAMSLGYAVETDTSSNASSVLNTIYRSKIDYDELKVLILGLFSRKPNNLFDNNYTELRGDILEGLYDAPSGDEAVFAVLLLLLKESRKALEVCEETYAGPEYSALFKRFYSDDKPRYRVYFAIAALCALLRDDVSERSPTPETEVSRMSQFLAKARAELENNYASYHEAFLFAFSAVAESVLDIPTNKAESEISQNMYTKISSSAFTSLFKKVLMRLDSERQRRRASS